MMLDEPFPQFDEIVNMIGEAGRRLSEIDASEGAAGNISVYIGWPVEPRRKFPVMEMIDLPQPAPELEGKTFLVSGSGRRLREILLDPVANLGCVVVEPGGLRASLYTAPGRYFERLTSEFNSHLAVHYDQVIRSGTNFHAVIHAQPPYLTYLSHLPPYREASYLNHHLLRWQPELIINLPEGIGPVAFHVPGSAELMSDTVEALRRHRVIVWCKHGAVARSDISVKRAADRIEYAETAARYEYFNLVAGEPADGLSVAEIREICQVFGVQQDMF